MWNIIPGVGWIISLVIIAARAGLPLQATKVALSRMKRLGLVRHKSRNHWSV